MIKEALEYVAGRVRPEFVPVAKRLGLRSPDYAPMDLPVDEFQGEPLKFSTLTSMIDYANAAYSLDGEGMPIAPSTQLILQVVSACEVRLLLPVSEHRTRRCIAVAMPQQRKQYFDGYIPLETFIIWMAGFDDTGDKHVVLKAVSKVSTGTTIDYADDGITQKVDVKRGVHLVERADLKPIVRLCPLRSFLDSSLIRTQSDFILRVCSKETGIDVGLFEADGGAWEADQMQNIKLYLKTHIHVPAIVLA